MEFVGLGDDYIYMKLFIGLDIIENFIWISFDVKTINLSADEKTSWSFVEHSRRIQDHLTTTWPADDHLTSKWPFNQQSIKSCPLDLATPYFLEGLGLLD